MQGNGQAELVEALTGLRPVQSGQIWLQGHDVSNARPRSIIQRGTAHIPEDRQKHGLVLTYPVDDNMVLQTYYQAPFSKGLNINPRAVRENAERLVEAFDVRTPSVDTPTGSLSGGNQQKVIVARELDRPIRLLIAAQPTRGLDVGSIEYIHRLLIEKRDEGIGVFLVSSELDEIMSLSDHIAVMFEGRIVATVDAATVTREQIGLLMAGALPEEVLQGQQGESTPATG